MYDGAPGDMHDGMSGCRVVRFDASERAMKQLELRKADEAR